MICNEFQGKQLSRLGFGAMRLPVMEDGSINVPLTREMVDVAIKNGVNYFDTAYPYHGGMSEVVMGDILSEYPRDSYYLATKYPGHQIAKEYHPNEIFEEQLEKCKVDYFDFYLLHNVYEKSIDNYKDSKWGIVDYFIEQKKMGRIKHLGFSCHGGIEVINEFLDLYGEHMEFCQIQLNYLDWTLQKAKEKYELLTSRGVAVWVMEPVRGGKLANLPESDGKRLQELRPQESIASWCFRFLLKLPNVKMILSGMSDMEQVVDNIKTFSADDPISDTEEKVLLEIADNLKSGLPCTACRYCVEGCPKGLDIPKLLALRNEFIISPTNLITTMQVESLAEDKRPDACVGCGACTKVCPQNINIPEELKKLDATFKGLPSWEEICRKRNEENQKVKEQK